MAPKTHVCIVILHDIIFFSKYSTHPKARSRAICESIKIPPLSTFSPPTSPPHRVNAPHHVPLSPSDNYYIRRPFARSWGPWVPACTALTSSHTTPHPYTNTHVYPRPPSPASRPHPTVCVSGTESGRVRSVRFRTGIRRGSTRAMLAAVGRGEVRRDIVLRR